jgi:hypothetical protein
MKRPRIFEVLAGLTALGILAAQPLAAADKPSPDRTPFGAVADAPIVPPGESGWGQGTLLLPRLEQEGLLVGVVTECEGKCQYTLEAQLTGCIPGTGATDANAYWFGGLYGRLCKVAEAGVVGGADKPIEKPHAVVGTWVLDKYLHGTFTAEVMAVNAAGNEYCCGMIGGAFVVAEPVVGPTDPFGDARPDKVFDARDHLDDARADGKPLGKDAFRDARPDGKALGKDAFRDARPDGKALGKDAFRDARPDGKALGKDAFRDARPDGKPLGKDAFRDARPDGKALGKDAFRDARPDGKALGKDAFRDARPDGKPFGKDAWDGVRPDVKPKAAWGGGFADAADTCICPVNPFSGAAHKQKPLPPAPFDGFVDARSTFAGKYGTAGEHGLPPTLAGTFGVRYVLFE